MRAKLVNERVIRNTGSEESRLNREFFKQEALSRKTEIDNWKQEKPNKQNFKGPQEIDKIKAFAKENKIKFDTNKNGTPFVSIPVYYQMTKGYDQLHWPVLVTEVAYTFTIVEDNPKPISLRKIFYGHEPKAKSIFFWRYTGGLKPDDFDLKKIIAELDKINEGIKHLAPRPEDEVEKNAAIAKKGILKQPQSEWIELARAEKITLSPEEFEKSRTAIQKRIMTQLKTDKTFLKETNLNQSLMGRFGSIDEALDRVKGSIEKERKKK